MKPFDFILTALAVWRIANMLVNEDGPWMAFEHLRLKAGLQPPAYEGLERETDPPGKMPGSLFSCVWCMSVWVATAFWLLWTLNKKIAKWLAVPLACSAVACLLDWMNGWSDR